MSWMVPCCSLKLHVGCTLSFLTEVSTRLVLSTAGSNCSAKLFAELFGYHRREGWEEHVCFQAQRQNLVFLGCSWKCLLLLLCRHSSLAVLQHFLLLLTEVALVTVEVFWFLDTQDSLFSFSSCFKAISISFVPVFFF